MLTGNLLAAKENSKTILVICWTGSGFNFLCMQQHFLQHVNRLRCVKSVRRRSGNSASMNHISIENWSEWTFLIRHAALKTMQTNPPPSWYSRATAVCPQRKWCWDRTGWQLGRWQRGELGHMTAHRGAESSQNRPPRCWDSSHPLPGRIYRAQPRRGKHVSRRQSVACVFGAGIPCHRD